jgi:hypothetical protein
MRTGAVARSDAEEIDFLLAGAAWQDTLLQNYRIIHLTLQSIFLAIGVGLSVAIFSAGSKLVSYICCAELVVFGCISVFVLFKMRKMIISRGHDVSYWHRLIVRAEQPLPAAQRHFTRFKVHQRTQRAGVEDLHDLFLGQAKELTDKQADLLIGRGLSHTRLVLDVWLFFAMLFIWVALLVVGLGYIFFLAAR